MGVVIYWKTMDMYAKVLQLLDTSLSYLLMAQLSVLALNMPLQKYVGICML